MREILFHPGFHRTGTSSIQHFLWRNHESLAPHVQLMMLRHLKPVVRLCAHFSTTKNPLDLLEMSELLDTAFTERALPDTNNLIISCEGLSGHMPGRNGVDDYSAAPLLIQYFVSYLQERFPDARVRVILSTRDSESWLRSVYRYQLRATRLTLDEDTFVARFAQVADFDTLLSDIATLLEETEVLFLPLEEAKNLSSGPGGALIQQIELPTFLRQSLVTVSAGNEGPDAAMQAEFLRLNQSELGNSEVATLKQGLAEKVNLGAWKKT